MKSKFISFFILVMFVFSFYATSFGQDDYAVVLQVKGRVIVLKKDEIKWIKARPGMKLSILDRLKTGGWGSYTEISFSKDNDKIVKIFNNTEVLLKELQPKVNINLDRGKIYSLIESLGEKSSFEIRTPTAICGARGTGWEISFNSKTTAGCYENFIFVQGIDEQGQPIPGELIVKEGFKTVVEEFQRPRELFKITEKEWRFWNMWREDIEEFLIESEQMSFVHEQMEEATSQETRVESKIKGREDFFEIREMERIEERIQAETPTTAETTTTTPPASTTTTGGSQGQEERETEYTPKVFY
jgi:hypothetical protein